MSSNKSERRERLKEILFNYRYNKRYSLDAALDDLEQLRPNPEDIENAKQQYFKTWSFTNSTVRAQIFKFWDDAVNWAINFSHADLGKKGGG